MLNGWLDFHRWVLLWKCEGRSASRRGTVTERRHLDHR
jgi:hypothetical protein